MGVFSQINIFRSAVVIMNHVNKKMKTEFGSAPTDTEPISKMTLKDNGHAFYNCFIFETKTTVKEKP
jgi:hypothetical protein